MDIEKLLQALKDNLLGLLGDKLKDFKPQLEKDINEYIKQSREKLERWALLFAEGSITNDELEWLLKSQQDLIALKALQTAGLSKIKLNNLKNSIIQTIFKTVILAI
jgi:hypothetical protein